jgi:hypothetical protein
VTEASFLVHLLDTDIISLTGHVIDCPPSLSTGVTILLNVKVFLTRKAFEKPDKTAREETGTFWQEQKETADEEAMRQRKEALGFLFGEPCEEVGDTHADSIRPNWRQSSAVECSPSGPEEEWLCDDQ